MSIETEIEKKDWPSNGDSYTKDVITLRNLSNKEYINIISSSVETLENRLEALFRKSENKEYKYGQLMDYPFDQIEAGDKFFLFNKLKEISSLSNIVKFDNMKCVDGHDNRVEIDIVKDVDIKHLKLGLKTTEVIVAENGMELPLATYKVATFENYKRDLLAAIPSEMKESFEIDEDIINFAATIQGTDPLTAYDIFTGEIMNTETISQTDINKIAIFLNERDFGLDIIEKKCSHSGCQRSLLIDPIFLYSRFIQIR